MYAERSSAKWHVDDLDNVVSDRSRTRMCIWGHIGTWDKTFQNPVDEMQKIVDIHHQQQQHLSQNRDELSRRRHGLKILFCVAYEHIRLWTDTLKLYTMYICAWMKSSTIYTMDTQKLLVSSLHVG